MFEGFANVWTPLVEVRRVGRAPLRVMLAGEALVLFRHAEGVSALLDRCPHRGAALSLGQVCADGTIECPFHGWRFDRTGANVQVPLDPGARREHLGAVALPTRILGEMVWVYTAPGAVAPEEPVAPEGLTAPGLARTYVERIWDCHWTRAMENMLDSPHLPFVHRRTIGRLLRRRMTPTSQMEIDWQPTAAGGRVVAALDGRSGGGSLEFFRPNMMALTIPIPRRHFRIHALVTPMDAQTTRLTLVASRDFARSRLLEPLFARSNRRIADEDQRVVESARPREIPPAGQERSVATDAATLQFRKYYFEVLRTSRASGGR